MSDELPPGWALTDIGTLGRYVNGRGFGKAEWRKSGLPIIRIQNLNDESAAFNYSDQAHEEKYRVSDGDLLVAWAASLGVYVWKRGPAWLNQHIFRVEVEESAVTKPFLFYALKDALAALYKKAHGSGMVHITKAKFDDHPIKLPPIGEQKRIVSKIDELFSRIDEGERALDQVSKLVERYRQSVLKAAVTGELTRDWRAARKARGEPVESGEALLTRILTARRAAWEQSELAKMKAKGIKPANDNWKKKYKEPAPPATVDLPELPEGWVWASLPQLAWASSYGTSQKCAYGAGGEAVLRIPNVRCGEFSYGDIKNATKGLGLEPGEELAAGDLLVIRTNGSESLIGTGSVLQGAPPFVCSFASYLIRFRLALPGELAEWVNVCWQSDLVRRFVHANKASSAGQYNVSQSSLMNLCLPVPPTVELRLIVDEVARVFSQTEGVFLTTSSRAKASQALRQGVLKAAFSGNLVPQDPADEPATALLERIAAERATASADAPKRGRRKKST